jgi:lipopolysaccharide/colanic/teichoic acid biosynthesis glycosyltransferase
MALVLLMVLLPLFVLIMIVLFFVNRGKPFFFQLRPGKEERIFRLVKFKTMTDRKDSQGNLLPDHQRMTAFGKFLRKTSLDEIPQLLNVLNGSMSMIGPRPLLVEYLQHYNKEQKRRHSIRPGITGWAQVNGRNAISWQKKFQYDVWYVEHVNFSVDVKILWLTLIKVVRSRDINSSDLETMSRFTGNADVIIAEREQEIYR